MKRFSTADYECGMKTGNQSFASCADNAFSAMKKLSLTDAVKASVLLSVLVLLVVLPGAVRLIPAVLLLAVLLIMKLKPNTVSTEF